MTATTPGPAHPRLQGDGREGRLVEHRVDSTSPQPTPSAPTSGATKDDRDRELLQLRERLARCRRERERAEHDAAAEAMLQREIVAVRRDRDAGTSPTLRRDRGVFERLLADVDDLVVLAARMSVRLGVYGLSADHPHVHSGVVAGNACLDAVAALAAALDPPPIPTSAADDTSSTVTNGRAGARRPRGPDAGSAA